MSLNSSSASTITKSATDSATPTTHYEVHLNGAKGYGLFPRLYDSRNLDFDVSGAVDLIGRMLNDIERESARTVKTFVVGKSQVKRRKKFSFDPREPTTWTVSGTGSLADRWSEYESQGYDGLIVFACFPRTSVPLIALGQGRNHEQYTLAVEAGVHGHYSFVAPDPRYLPSTGDRREEKLQHAGLLYLAYKFHTPAEQAALNPEDDDDDDDDVADDASAANFTVISTASCQTTTSQPAPAAANSQNSNGSVVTRSAQSTVLRPYNSNNKS